MKFLLPPALLGSLLLLVSFIDGKKDSSLPLPASPLAIYSPAWNDARYLVCNTAAKAGYMTAEERDLIYILNMARMNPVLFANTVVKQYPDKNGSPALRNSENYRSLLHTLQQLKPLNLLYPDSLCYKSALCHAISSGKEGYVGHDRRNGDCQHQQYFNGECCDYGHDRALDILLSFLVDEGVPSLGHREICLGSYQRLGVSIQSHIKYNHTAVLDFHY